MSKTDQWGHGDGVEISQWAINRRVLSQRERKGPAPKAWGGEGIRWWTVTRKP